MIEKVVHENKEKQVDWGLYILEKIHQTTEKEIDDFRKKVLPKEKKHFEELPEDKKIIYSAIDSLADNEVTALRKYEGELRVGENKKLYLPGIHDVFNTLFIIGLFTDKYR